MSLNNILLRMWTAVFTNLCMDVNSKINLKSYKYSNCISWWRNNLCVTRGIIFPLAMQFKTQLTYPKKKEMCCCQFRAKLWKTSSHVSLCLRKYRVFGSSDQYTGWFSHRFQLGRSVMELLSREHLHTRRPYVLITAIRGQKATTFLVS